MAEQIPDKDVAAAMKSIAEAEKAKAEAALAEEELVRSKMQTASSRIELEGLKRRESRRQSGADIHKIYYFCEDVDQESVLIAVQELTVWSRQDPGCEIEVVITSNGGNMVFGMFFFDFLRSLSEKGHLLTTGVYGKAASMASCLAMAGDRRWMGESAWLMLHTASIRSVGGPADQVESTIGWVKGLEERMLEIFELRSEGNLQADEIKEKWRDGDWWISAEECLELGLITEIRGKL